MSDPMVRLEGRAVFLDRDGTLIDDVGYPRDPEQVRLIDGCAAALAVLQKRGYRLIVVSNQSGIGRGLVTVPQAERVHRRVIDDFARAGVHFDAAYYCPHAPEDQCACRKPAPGMLQQAAKDLHLDPARCFLVGDKASDLEAGRRVGCRTILFAPSGAPAHAEILADARAATWPEVQKYILEQTEAST